MKTVCVRVYVCVDLGEPGDGDPPPAAQRRHRSSSEGENAAEAEELDAGNFLFSPDTRP